jgi:hypothetical protein
MALPILKCQYPFLFSDGIEVRKVRCTLCKSIFSVSDGGRYDIGKHIRAKSINNHWLLKHGAKIYSLCGEIHER